MRRQSRNVCIGLVMIFASASMLSAQEATESDSTDQTKTDQTKKDRRCDEQIVMYGGNFETWVWEGKNWVQKFPASSPLTGRAMAYDKVRREVILFGKGADNASETWGWDGITWTQKFPLNSPPPNFGSGLMVYDIARQEMVLQGSAYIIEPTPQTWVYKDETWTQKFPLTHPLMVFDDGTMAYDADTRKTILFGGTELGAHFGDSETMEWDGSNWAYKNSPKSPDGMLGGETAAYDASRHEVVLLGQRLTATSGSTVNNVPETWVWRGSKWKQLFPKVSPAVESEPMAYDAANHTLVLFKASDVNSPYPETWVWNGTGWKQKSPLSQPSTQPAYPGYVMSSNVVPRSCPGGRD